MRTKYILLKQAIVEPLPTTTSILVLVLLAPGLSISKPQEHILMGGVDVKLGLGCIFYVMFILVVFYLASINNSYVTIIRQRFIRC